MVQSADILIADVKTLLPIIARRAKEYKFTPCIGRSHGIHAEPTTFGLKLALMHDEFGRALERLESRPQSRRRRQTFAARSAPTRICRRASRLMSAKNLACARRRSPRKSSSATSTPNS